MFRFVCDPYGSWFMIPEDRYDEWDEFMSMNSDEEYPRWMEYIGDSGALSEMVFEKAERKI